MYSPKQILQTVAITLLAIFSLSAIAVASDLTPPMAKIVPKIDTMFGVEMIDNYFWLRERENPEVIEYIEAENRYSDAMMQHTEDFQKKLYEELKGRIKETDLSVPVRHGDYFYYYRNEEGEQYKIYCRKKGSLEGEEEILLDVNQLAEGKEFMRVGTYEISPDHSHLAFSTDEKGNERYQMHFKNLVTGEMYTESIDNTAGDLAWASDNKTVFYTIPDEAWRPYRLYRHILGTDPSEDVLVYQEDDEMFWMGISRTKSGAYIILSFGSQVTEEHHYLEATNPTGTFKVIAPRRHEVEYSVTHHSDKFYIVTNDDAINFKVMTAPVNNPDVANWSELVSHSDEVKIDYVEMFENYMVLYGRENGLKIMRVTDLNSGVTHTIEFPEPVYSFYSSSNPEFKSEMLRFTYMSLTTPNSVYDYNMTTHERILKKQKEVLGGYDASQYQSERVFATASDGTKIPMSLVYKKGMVKDGSQPLYLYGYGSYGASMDPWFSTNRISLMDRGVIYAVAHIRGGGEMGRKWYLDGKYFNKKNTFTDFIACGEHLVAEKYTSADRMGCGGGSAGGLLIGAVVNMRPDLFHVAVASVPFVDVVNTMLDATIPLTVIEYEEWGNPNKEDFFNYMLSYSPYDNVKAQDYPRMLIKSSLNDTRVQYWEGTKWAAKLRANKTDDHCLILKTNMGAGHGGSSGRYDYLEELAFQYAFVLDQLGITE